MEAYSQGLDKKGDQDSGKHCFDREKRYLSGGIQIGSSPSCHPVDHPENNRRHKEQIVQHRPDMIVTAKRRDQHNDQRNAPDQLPFIIHHLRKQHPDQHADCKQKEHSTPLKRRFLLIISEIIHSPLSKHKKQHRNTDTVNHLTKL